jgi:hypothetical protein
MSIDLVLYIVAAICFGADAWQKRSLVAAGFCLITIALWIL